MTLILISLVLFPAIQNVSEQRGSTRKGVPGGWKRRDNEQMHNKTKLEQSNQGG